MKSITIIDQLKSERPSGFNPRGWEILFREKIKVNRGDMDYEFRMIIEHNGATAPCSITITDTAEGLEGYVPGHWYPQRSITPWHLLSLLMMQPNGEDGFLLTGSGEINHCRMADIRETGWGVDVYWKDGWNFYAYDSDVCRGVEYQRLQMIYVRW